MRAKQRPCRDDGIQKIDRGDSCEHFMWLQKAVPHAVRTSDFLVVASNDIPVAERRGNFGW